MQEKIKQIPRQIVDFWNRFTKKQKMLICSVVAMILLTLIILWVVMSQTKYTLLSRFETTKETAEVQELLDKEGIEYRLSDDGLSIEVDSKKVANARLILGKNGILANGWEYSDAFSGGFSTTETEKDRMYILAFRTDLANSIKTMDGIRDAQVQITLPEESNTIYEKDKHASASVLVTTTKELSEESVLGIATFVACALGESNNDNVRIVDQKGMVLFAGDVDGSYSSGVGSSYDYKKKIIAQTKMDLTNLLLKSGVFDDAEVAPNLVINQDDVKTTDTQYSTPEGKDQGPYKNQYVYNAEGGSGTGGVPGTDSNDGVTDYDIPTGGSSSGTVNIQKYEHAVNEKTTVTVQAKGSIVPEQSSVAVVLTKYKKYNEADLKKQGKLKKKTFAEFMEENSEKTPITVEEDVYTAVSMATGISRDDISIVAYEVPVFTEDEGSSFTLTNWLQIILFILIAGLLIFVVFMGMKPVDVIELEPELSVEALLATTKENQTLDDIEFSEKSETRQQIEKFVDENPEAVALLLRNWFNEDWE